jgi:hypothetical protein
VLCSVHGLRANTFVILHALKVLLGQKLGVRHLVYDDSPSRNGTPVHNVAEFTKRPSHNHIQCQDSSRPAL